ncbi:MAG: hypothetical protein ABMA64_35905 [Myxococcota bacterium]
MLSDDTTAFRADAPELIERGTDTVVRLRPSRAGAALTPTSAAVTLRDASGAVVIAAAPATCAGGQAVYTVAGATSSPLALGPGWSVSWTVRLPGESVDRTVRIEAAMVRARLYPVVSDADLFRRARALDPANPRSRDSAVQDYSTFLDDAWSRIHERLNAVDRRPWLILSPHALREVHLTLTLALVYEDLAARNASYVERAKEFRQQYRDAWSELKFVYDESDTGAVAGQRKAHPGPTWLGGRYT